MKYNTDTTNMIDLKQMSVMNPNLLSNEKKETETLALNLQVLDAMAEESIANINVLFDEVLNHDGVQSYHTQDMYLHDYYRLPRGSDQVTVGQRADYTPNTITVSDSLSYYVSKIVSHREETLALLLAKDIDSAEREKLTAKLKLALANAPLASLGGNHAIPYIYDSSNIDFQVLIELLSSENPCCNHWGFQYIRLLAAHEASLASDDKKKV